MSTREEHVAACKARALKYLDRHDVEGALTSMMSDIEQHPETKNHVGNTICIQLMMTGSLSTEDEARRFINGYN